MALVNSAEEDVTSRPAGMTPEIPTRRCGDSFDRTVEPLPLLVEWPSPQIFAPGSDVFDFLDPQAPDLVVFDLLHLHATLQMPPV
ncbi:MAG TPA: hypothetical protein VFB60_16460 [Ktedonobacteraceae bacterium]|nr:hypothetical protein [Ktedonobacteraceae bacterium]